MRYQSSNDGRTQGTTSFRRALLACARLVGFGACGCLVVALWACNSRTLVPSRAQTSVMFRQDVVQSLNRKLDLLFLIDDSPSMLNSQRKLSARLPEFMEALRSPEAGLPDLHVAVVSSSMGAGLFSNVGNCRLGTRGNLDGDFQHSAACTGLHAGETFIKASAGGNNFDGDIGQVFGCLALLGADGCGFEQQLAAVQRALQRATSPADPVNAGFLRDDAYLGVVMLTNEDDCSVPFDSTLFDPTQTLLRDQLGGLQSYRCNEFGHLCGGNRPPHDVTAPTMLEDCVPAEGAGRLTPVADFVTFLKGLKNNEPGKVMVAALAGAPTPYVVEKVMVPNAPELQPDVRPSCRGDDDDKAAPALRVNAWVRAFGDNGVFDSICDNDFGPSMRRIAQVINRALEPSCLSHLPVNVPGTDRPDCVVEETVNGEEPGRDLPACNANLSTFPCWRLADQPRCATGKVLQLCRDATCTNSPSNLPEGTVVSHMACATNP